ncbi:hypothetical protein [Nocardia asteroides]|uniref:hypothetical protein n=1 Tax=Nocardia asteroides TaxID=1824 RepID=UPI001E3F3301|nr:hypothetical protein [Nocardia asteroides]UGT61786.1 hypothetical protein LTT61_00035 [Nocardia asteroides]
MPCAQCRRPRLLGLDTGTVLCRTAGCAEAGLHAELERVLDAAPVDHNPAGADRPTDRGIPIPWITLVTGGHPGLRAHWRMIHRRRIARGQADWLCQHCGLDADPAATVVLIDTAGRCPSPAPLHPDCARVSAAHCPYLLGTDIRAVVITRGQQQCRGELIPDIGISQPWSLHPDSATQLDLR